MKSRALIFLILGVGAAGQIWAQSSPASPAVILERYRAAVKMQVARLRNVQMEVTFEGKLPDLEKKGELRTLRYVSEKGEIRNQPIEFKGDDVIKRQLIARYMTAEIETTQNAHASGSMAIDQENYKFNFKGLVERYGRQYYIFELKPRKARIGLFKGELWIDPVTYMPLREYGEFVKSPSIFLKDVSFVRDYWILDGISVPRRIISSSEVRLAGTAELVIWFSDYVFQNPAQSSMDLANRR